MSDSLDAPAPGALPPALSLTTPTGLQSIDELTRRRRIVLGLNLISYALMLWWAGRILGAGGWTWVDGDPVRVFCARHALGRARFLERADRAVASQRRWHGCRDGRGAVRGG